ncbi:MAG TPA: O-antigen ligase family protein, partial [Gemmataceae bacterium]|nr:O-antigen ligase family protein [Gemmataceae bacterium]
ALGVVGFLLRGRYQEVLAAPQVWLLLLLAAWGLLQTYPYLSEYKADALRDAAIWGYGAFAILVFSYLLAEPTRLAALVRTYRHFPPLFLAVIPVAWTITRIFPRVPMPRWPWADVPVLETKGGDIMVHVAGILAFWVFGLGGRVRAFWVLPMAACIVLVGTYDRAGLLSFLAVFGLCLCLRPRNHLLWRLIAIGLCGIVLLAATGIRVQMPGREREVSFEQLVANLTSTVSSSSAGDLDATKEWRLEWWGDIYDYTIRGKYFWTGKGFGINLASDDGYQVEEDEALRNPHNGHLTMLARSGVPGLALWLLVQLSWAVSVFLAYRESRRRGEQTWPELFLFLLAYWLAFMINTSFDVYLEGPMGGVWYWTVYGVGLAAVAIHRKAACDVATVAKPLAA